MPAIAIFFVKLAFHKYYLLKSGLPN